MEAAWADLCQKYSLEEMDDFANLFESAREPTEAELSLLDKALSFLTANLQQSVEHVIRWMPDVTEDVIQPLTIAFLPYGKYTFSPKAGLQLFSLDPYASPTETYLFLVHVYYHELSALNDTPNGRRCSREQSSADDFKEWIRLLIRNEGIGNYAVLDDLIQLRDARSDYAMRYFTYARKIGNPDLLQSSISILTDAFTGVNDHNVAQFSTGINRLFKNEALPIINLVGIHMAESIADHHGTAVLKNVYHKEARDFFALYGQTPAQFSKALGDL